MKFLTALVLRRKAAFTWVNVRGNAAVFRQCATAEEIHYSLDTSV